DHLSRDRLLAGIRSASTHAEPQDRAFRSTASLPRQSLGGRLARCCRRLGDSPFLTVRSPILRALFVLGPYGVLYFVFTIAFGLTEAREGLERGIRLLRRLASGPPVG